MVKPEKAGSCSHRWRGDDEVSTRVSLRPSVRNTETAVSLPLGLTDCGVDGSSEGYRYWGVGYRYWGVAVTVTIDV